MDKISEKYFENLDISQLEERNSTIIHNIEDLDPNRVDEVFNRTTVTVFDKINCLDCARCCRNYKPIIELEDITGLMKSLNLTFEQLLDEYIYMDEDGDFVFNQTPCPMLDLSTNKCKIYKDRPKSCQEYPHTNQNIINHLDILAINAMICPAVDKILAQIDVLF